MSTENGKIMDNNDERIIDGVTYRISYRARQLGAWKWAKSRGYYRILAIPGACTADRCQDLRHPDITEVYAGGDCTLDYPGGKYGYQSCLDRAKQVLAEL